mgnify:CR=1 FL=1
MESITLDIKRVNGKIHRAISNKCRDNNLDITPVQGRLLMFISEHDDVSATDILDELKSVNKSTLSEILNLMEKNNLINRIESKLDSRRKLIVLTNKSKEVVKHMKENFNSINEIALTGVSDKDKVIFKKVLEQIGRNMDNL